MLWIALMSFGIVEPEVELGALECDVALMVTLGQLCAFGSELDVAVRPLLATYDLEGHAVYAVLLAQCDAVSG